MDMLPFVCSYHSMWFLGRSLNVLLYIAALESALVIAPIWRRQRMELRWTSGLRNIMGYDY
jgi:hypothetical protein